MGARTASRPQPSDSDAQELKLNFVQYVHTTHSFLQYSVFGQYMHRGPKAQSEHKKQSYDPRDLTTLLRAGLIKPILVSAGVRVSAGQRTP
jgi:hypothetical protein